MNVENKNYYNTINKYKTLIKAVTNLVRLTKNCLKKKAKNDIRNIKENIK